MVVACERDAFLLSRGQMVDASRPLVLFHRFPLSPVLHGGEERKRERERIEEEAHTGKRWHL